MARFVFFILIMFSVNQGVFGQNWFWGRNTSGGGNQRGRCISTDINGNSFVTGWYWGSFMAFGTNTITTNGGTNAFLAKYDSSGMPLWARNVGGGAYDYGYSVSADAAGDAIVVGMFTSTTLIIGSSTYTNAGDRDIFIAKFDSSGNLLWSKGFGGIAKDEAFAVTTDANNNVYVAGQFSSPFINFGGGTVTNNTSSMFLVKYDAAGTFQWLQRSFGGSDNFGVHLCCDALGNILLSGSFVGNSLNLGQATLNSTNSYCTGDGFLAKYNSSGNLLWLRKGGDAASTDQAGNVYITGCYSHTTSVFGSYTLNLSPGNPGHTDLFIAKYNSTGNIAWAKRMGGGGGEAGLSIGADGTGHVFVSGRFYSPTINLGNFTLTDPNPGTDSPMFIAKLDSSGNVVCASSLPTGGYLNTISVDKSGTVMLEGDQWSQQLIIGNDTLNRYYYSVFIAKYECKDILTTVSTISDNTDQVIYPNPSTGIFYLIVQNGTGKLRLKVYDVLGNCIVDKFSNIDSLPRLDLSEQPQGIYFIEMVDEQESIMKKVIKE